MVAAVPETPAPSRAEFHRAIAATSDRWFAACVKITGDRGLAEDAVQDALATAWVKRHQFAGNAALTTWIHRIAVNAALQIVRRRQPDFVDPQSFEVTDEAGGPAELHRDFELDEALRQAFSVLTEMERVCFVLKHLEQWRIREIMEALDLAEGTVKQAVFRAVRKLRPRLADLREGFA